jgi:hypothetical protein
MATAVTEASDLSPQAQIRRYLALAEEARKNAKSPYAGLFAALPPDPHAMMVKDLAVIYVIVGAVLFLAAVIAAAQTLFPNSDAQTAT